VLAAVAAGVYGGWKGPELLTASARLSGVAVWTLLVFLLNCVLFVLIGLDLRQVLGTLSQYSLGRLIAYGAIASGLVILIRPIWVFPATWLPRLLSRRIRQRDPIPPWQNVTIVSWSGMRGVVSLAAALALPRFLAPGRPLPGRELVIFLSFCVILSTLVFQGLSLPLLIRWLGVKERKSEERGRDAKLRIAHAALARLNSLAEEAKANEPALERVIAIYQERINHLNDSLAATLGWSPEHERLIATRRLWLQALIGERQELVKLRRTHAIDEELMHEIEHELDLEETRLRTWSL
jgi:CPA1 family monovalent cation:H+ antiporter